MSEKLLAEIEQLKDQIEKLTVAQRDAVSDEEANYHRLTLKMAKKRLGMIESSLGINNEGKDETS